MNFRKVTRRARPRRARNRAGWVLLFTLMSLGVLGTIIGALLGNSVFQRRQADRYQLYTEEFAIAEYQVNKTFGEVSYALKKAGGGTPLSVINSICPATVPNYKVQDFSVQLLSDSTAPVTSGYWAGYTLRQLLCRVSVSVKRTDARGAMYEHPGVALQQDMVITYVPLYVFGIFSSVDLEIHPGENFTETGRVHSNRDLYYGSDNKNMDIQNYVTAAGHLNYGRHPNSGKGLGQGRNRFWDGKQFVDSNQDGVNVDYKYDRNGKTWVSEATDLWKGYVRDHDMGVSPLNMPWPDSVPSSTFIQPKSSSDFGPLLTEKMVYKAGLIITRQNGVTSAMRADGTPVSLSYRSGGRTLHVDSTGSFYNEREATNINVLNLDLGSMQEAGICPPNGIIYVQFLNADGSVCSNGAVRILNGAELPGDHSLGFTLATPNALYVQGNYNTENETDSMLACDAINILSPGWKDSENTESNRKNDKVPNASGDVTLNAVLAGGNVPTQVDAKGNKHYSGGVENFFRYLEKWNGSVTHTFKGSVLLMFNSVLSKGTWDSQKYSAPKRVWSWNPRLATHGPPGAPVTYDTRRMNWSIRY